MYNRYLDSFILVAECGSITNAAQRMYISATALTKQINALEKHLDVKLFDRNSKGVVLTEAGEYVFREAKELVESSARVIRTARELDAKREHVIRLGTSLMNSNNILFPYFADFAKSHPNIHLRVVPYKDEHKDFLYWLDCLGIDVDILSVPTAMPFGDGCKTLKLVDLPAEIALSRQNPLAQKVRLSPEDLHCKYLIMLERGVASDSDAVRSFLQEKHPEVNIIDVHRYEVETYNSLVSESRLMLCSGQWLNSYPMLTTVPVDWEFTIPYGILYSAKPRYGVRLFVEYLKETLASDK